MFVNIYGIRSILLVCLGLQNHVAAQSTFAVSFQTDIEGPFLANSSTWIEFSNKMPSAKEFTVCHWLRIKYFNLNIAACLWTYCTIEYSTEDNMNCLELCLMANKSTANRNLAMDATVYLHNYGRKFIITPLNSYHHRTWVHLCWSFSAKTGKSKFYHNGELLSVNLLNVTDNDWGIKGSDMMYDTALIFGQEPDTMRGGFDKSQAYLGELSEFNIWNYTLNKDDIMKMASCKSWPDGNLIAWNLTSVSYTHLTLPTNREV